MRKSYLVILATLLIVIMIVVGAGIAYGQGNPPRPPPPPKMPLPLESIPPEERAVTYSFANQEDVSGLGMQLPRALTSQENDEVIQISLNVDPVSEKINQGKSYRPELIWMVYNKNSDWGYINQIRKVTQVKPETTYFPGVRIGLGTPQQEEIDVAVDLSTKVAIYAIRRPDKRVNAPPYISYLSQEQKEKMTTIALKAEEVQKYIKSQYEIYYEFVAINNSGSAFSLEYDIVMKGIPEYKYKDIEDKSMIIYPAVVFKTDSWMVSITIDLEKEKVLDAYPHPIR